MRHLTIPSAFAVIILFSLLPVVRPRSRNSSIPATEAHSYLGFDLNEYPGDAALPVLRKTFSFSSYWLGPPPGEKRTTWKGKRPALEAQGFGFVVLFNGKDIRSLNNDADAGRKGTADAGSAAKSAQQEGFPTGTIIFLDIEEGGRLPDAYHHYIRTWTEGLESAGYRAGVYCSGIPVSEGRSATITTAQDIQASQWSCQDCILGLQPVVSTVSGLFLPRDNPPPQQSGFLSAAVWQYAQSPRRGPIHRAVSRQFRSRRKLLRPGGPCSSMVSRCKCCLIRRSFICKMERGA